MHRYCHWALFALSLCSTTIAAASAGWADESSSSTTSSKARREAIRGIPLQRIAPEYRRQVKQVLTDTSLYRRLPTMTVDCHPPLFTYLAKNPDVLVQVWRQLGISNVDLVRVGDDTFRLTDTVGTVGRLVIVEQNCDQNAQNRLVMYVEGAFEGKPFKRPVRAQCVLLLRSGSVEETNGRHYVATRLDTFLRIDRASVALFAKAVHPLVGKMADRNFSDTINFISNMSQAAETRPLTIQRLANRLTQVSDEQKLQLVQITQECANQQAPTGNAISDRLAKAAK
jgi:hypothetical protein